MKGMKKGTAVPAGPGKGKAKAEGTAAAADPGKGKAKAADAGKGQNAKA